MNRFDRLSHELCAEIDVLEEENSALRLELKDARQKYSELLNNSLRAGQETSAGMLMLSLRLAERGGLKQP